MQFPPKDLLNGKVSFYAFQNVYRLDEGVYLIIEVYRANGYKWEWRPPEPFNTMQEALQYAKQWYLIFKSLR